VLPIGSLNELSSSDFATALKPLFETAPPLAAALYAGRPFASYEALLDTAEARATALPFEDQVRVLNAHPRIGADPASVSAASYREQGYSSEAMVDATELRRVYARLAELNAAYERKFGFRFVVFVNRRPKEAILEVLEARLRNTPEVELATGLHELFEIARDRLRTQSD